MHYSELDYDSYDEFLDGPEWKELHNYFYENCGPYKCGVCGKHRFLVLHKRTYQHLTLSSLRRRFLFNRLIIRWLRKYFTWLCRDHNNQVHFLDNGRRTPLTYKALLAREIVVKRRYNSLWRKFKQLRPSDVLNWMFSF